AMPSRQNTHIAIPSWDSLDDLVGRLLAVCGEAIGIRTGMAIEGLHSLKPHSDGHHVLRFDYVWASDRQPLVARLYSSSRSPWARSEPPVSKAQREFSLLRWLARQGLPVPDPIWLDVEGVALDSPAVLFPAMPGRGWQRLAPDLETAARATFRRLAFTQARIHAVKGAAWPGHGRLPTLPLDTVLAFLNDLASELEDSSAQALLDELLALRVFIHELDPVLVHGDYQLDNLLFEHGEISAVLDWEAAAWADPRWDIAYARCGLGPVADEYLALYEVASGRSLPHIHFWDALVAIRAMILKRWYAREQPLETLPRERARIATCEEIARKALHLAHGELP
ncbi:MAG TPA: phosphotransferase, partial [Ardenticatenaceae bacterium]|nr:phosphotransferase [Ardenticatenaceae bacterium]